MERLKRAALLITLIDKLHEHGSWCGETHIQKATYFFENVCHAPLKHEFILYKHGPYSFDLCDELTSLRVDGLLRLVMRHPSYGPSFSVTERGKQICEVFVQTVAKNQSKIDFVAKHLGNMGVVSLEKVATALYVIREKTETDIENCADYIHKLKPHISIEAAISALKTTDAIITEAKMLTF